ncbi:FkbM family methyltransferase [Asticcacaulis sp. AC460]|uniref:FkbM family methyltransferase n=1 Tax=Asticcacaulis sp. AC460 TaxID=1282360 RepID=UPI0006908F6F|nr:FkbM family methyltransferase [Asticcacaulis sp. AC460]
MRAILKAVLPGPADPIRIVDIGASPIDGDPPYAPLLAMGRAQVTGFEPDAAALAALNLKRGPAETYLPHAVGDGGRHILHICKAPGMTSLLEPNMPLLELFHGFGAWGRVIATEAVDTVRLDDVPEVRGVEYLKIDIQGGELMALQNAMQCLQTALLIHTEVEFLPMYVDQPLYADVDRFLRTQGFMIHRFAPLTSRAIKPLMIGNDPRAGFSQVLWADAVFVRDITRLDLMTADQLLRLAEILHDVYRSYDVSLHLLKAYDRRCGTACGDIYLQAVTARQPS